MAQSDDLLIPVKSEINHGTKTNSSIFNLANIVDSFLTNDNTQNDSAIDEKSRVRKEFITITSKFNQGNAKVAYDEYTKLIAKVQNDTSLLALSKVFYEIGFFSLGDSAIEKIVYKNQFYDNILDLESSYKPKSILSNEDEIYFAKAYSNIYFNNSADETIAELLEKKTQYVKNDFYNSILARAYFETRQYNLALNMINKAISLNPSNISYQIFKVEILIQNKKYSEAKKLIEKIEKTKLLIAYKPKLEILKQTVLAQVSSDINESKSAVFEGRSEVDLISLLRLAVNNR